MRISQILRAMAPVVKTFDYLVIGGGSGGLASARRAAEFGVKAAVIEEARWGGTCVSSFCNTSIHMSLKCLEFVAFASMHRTGRSIN